MNLLYLLLFLLCSFQEIMPDKPMDNTGRGFSNWLDDKMGWHDGYKDSSKWRAAIHYAKHQGTYLVNGNEREKHRATDVWNKANGGSTDNLKKYDEKVGYKKK